jgi:hypothetical protein
MTKKTDMCRSDQTKNEYLRIFLIQLEKNGEKILCRSGLGPKNKELAGPGLKSKTLPGPKRYRDQKIKFYRVRTGTLRN